MEVTTTSLLEPPFTPPYESTYMKFGSYTKTFAGFSITDENGIKYIFGSNGSTTNAIEYSIGFFKQNIDEWIATSWYLTTIQHPNGEKIDFTYERDSFIAQMYISVYKDITTKVVSPSGILGPPYADCQSSGTTDVGGSYSGQLTSPVYLSEVSTNNVKVKFVRTNTTELRYAQSVFDWQYSKYYSNPDYPSFLPFLEDNSWSTYPACLNKLQWKKLDQVRIEENKVLQKAFNFDYSKNINQRLTLLSLTEQGGSSNPLKPPYVFSYNTSVPLPDYLANTNDHWGFYNGIYAYTNDLNAYYNYRESKAGYLLAGTLNKIKYPTGGITDFLFEPNQYSQQAADNRENAPVMYEQDKIAGGLRIRKISSYDSLRLQEKVEKEYYYVKDYTGGSFTSFRSSGILGGQIKYYFDDYRVKSFSDDNVTYSKAIFSSQSVLPGNYNSQGSHIGYSEIIEKLSDGSYTKYTYSNLNNSAYRDLAADNSLQPNRIIYQPYTNREMNRGKLLSEQNYNSTDKLLRSKIINYQQIGTDIEVRALRALYFNVCPGVTVVSVEEATAYKFLAHSFLPINEQITVYQ